MEKDISIQIQEGLSKNANNYNKELYKMIKPYCGNNILEVGCSIGNITKLILKKDNKIVGVDVVDQAIKTIRKRFPQKNFKAHLIDGSDPKILKLGKFDTIVCMNVLEHIKHDERTLDHFYKLLEKGGYLILIVPAMPFLYGSVDRSDHHFRRYTKKTLKPKILKAKFKIVDLKYTNLLGTLGWFINGKILKKKMVDSSMLGFYDKVVPVTFAVEKMLPLPMGLSVFCIARKE